MSEEQQYDQELVLAHLGRVLEKATGDPYCYRMQLKTGQWLTFTEAVFSSPDWVELSGVEFITDRNGSATCRRDQHERPVSVRIDAIAVVIDENS